MTDPNDVTMHFGSQSVPARITALEGNRGYLRVRFDWSNLDFTPGEGTESVIEMHDGGRFAFVIVEPTSEPEGNSGEFRMKLVGRA